MTDKQERFCEEYMIDLNATQAAIRAGYSPRTASLKSDADRDDLAAVQSVKVKTFGEDGLEQEVKLADKL